MRARAILTLSVLLVLAAPVAAQAQAGEYTRCEPIGDAIRVDVSLTTCEDAAPVVTALLAQPPDAAPSVLAGVGWSPLRAQQATAADQHDLVAIRGLATLRLRRPGAMPDLDGWAAGRELLFARKPLVAGRRAPKASALCTSAFLIRLPSGTLGGLSAGHCGGLRRDRTVHRRNVALRRDPPPGIVLGRVLRILTRSKPLDALVAPVPQAANRPASPVIDRGIDLPPWRVVATARPLAGRRICMIGRTSGTVCGRIRGRIPGSGLRCTTFAARGGDSGGPVYTKPAADGTVRAIGLTTVIVPLVGNVMCFTPIAPVLRGLRAKLVAASL